MIRIIQGFNIALFLDLVIFVPAVGYHICLNLPAAFLQPGNNLIEMLCSLYMRWQKNNAQVFQRESEEKGWGWYGGQTGSHMTSNGWACLWPAALSLGPRTTWLSRIPPLPSFHVFFCSSFCCRTMQEMWRERTKEGEGRREIANMVQLMWVLRKVAEWMLNVWVTLPVFVSVLPVMSALRSERLF